MKFSINYFLSKCDQICSFLRIWSHFLKKSLMKTSFFLQCGKLYFLCSDCKRQDIFQIIIDFRQLRNSAAEFKNTLETFWYRSVLKYQNDPKWQCWFASIWNWLFQVFLTILCCGYQRNHQNFLEKMKILIKSCFICKYLLTVCFLSLYICV